MLQIGKLKLKHGIIQAPMAGCTDLAFRILSRPFGMELAFMEMVSAEALTRQSEKTRALLKTVPADRPLGAQIFGSKPSVMAEAARILEELGYDVIDINFGCPVPKIAGKGSGCAFLAKPADAADVVREVVKAIKKAPVTIKTRLGISDPSGAQGAVLAKIAQDCGCAAITIHGRTQRQGYSGHAHYDGIRTIKQAVRIPVIGNGDVTNFITARRMLEQTGVDGIMIGRGCLGNPWVFRQLCDAFDGKTPPSDPSLEQRKKTLLEHLELELQTRDEKTVVLMMRRIACWYFKGLPQVSVFRGRINTCKTVELVRRAILEF